MSYHTLAKSNNFFQNKGKNPSFTYLGWVVVCLFKDLKSPITCNLKKEKKKKNEVSNFHTTQIRNIHPLFAKLQRRESLSFREDFIFILCL